MRVVQAELYRLGTIRSWWVSLLAGWMLMLLIGVLGAGEWIFVVGLVAFVIGVVGGAQHYQHRTAVLVFLARPHRVVVLAAQALAYGLVAAVVTALGGLTRLVFGDWRTCLWAVLAAALLAVFGLANAVVLRRAIWIIVGYGVWFLVVEAFLGLLARPLPFSSYLGAASGRTGALAVLAGWVLASLAAAGALTRRDVNGS
ncbi:hypothetical protein [Dactylosporangium sp. NPDC051484]|uniref:hypothetical protein n=1 Tax=Dactylosporangium sp. NPDC051484 TaxID=3154942 RepID=UPI00344DE900